MSSPRNLETSAPGYNPYKGNSSGGDNRVLSDYDENRESFSTEITSAPDNILYPEEVALHRYTSQRKTDVGQVVRGDSLRKLARGDSVKQLPKLDRFDPTSGFNSSITAKKPVTFTEKFQSWMINEGGRNIFFFVWIFLHALVFVMAFLNYFFSDDLVTARQVFGITFTLARSAALVLHVDAAMILFPVCRNLISVLRSTPLGGIIPFDENLEFHKAIGWSIVFFTIVHTVAHWINFYELARAQNGGIVMWLELNFLTGPGATGYVMLISLFLMVFTATEKARRRHFNRFWYFHHLFIPFFGAWSFHGAFCMIKPDRPPYCNDIAVFWRYWIASGVVYISERILREIRAQQKTYISKVVMHPSKVVEIQIKKNVATKAGQYIFLCCPEVSYWEWHPFTLTSAPEEDYISIHIRVVGDFTEALAKKLGCNFEEEAALRKKNRDRIKSQYDGIDISSDNPKLLKVLPRVMIDGPFGSASEDVFKFEVAMLVGAGIGVTPFASVLKTLEEQDIEQFIEIHTYLTGRLRHSEVGNILVNDDGNIKDTITGLRAPTHFGRPNWDKIYSNMRDQYPATDVGVFFCGPVPLGKTLHEKSNLWSQGFEDGTRFFYGKD
ncbi:22562_t:CDS:2 [Dentiscutata erythropus]|uniref:22562_t:CDS:1 n=1 Tax=Dentiscutata erythropus TaxID=1348616 RepID=A0A9N9AH56_9GLOM|nr:22562_t:CDS:2 [Dentiscutata erythropus]